MKGAEFLLGFLVMKNKFLKILKLYDFSYDKNRILLAISGGKDSMCMLHLFNEIKDLLGFKLVVCHFNHSLRDEADQDELFVKNTCNVLGLDFYSKKEDVNLYCSHNKLSTEQGARELRYNFFYDVMEKEKLNYIATAHNKNDLAETVLMRIIRGTGINGLVGIRKSRDCLIRPMLDFSRDEIEDYVEKNNIPFVQDNTNFLDIYSRNKIRLKLMEELKTDYNEKIIDSLCRLSDIAFDFNVVIREYINSKKGDLWIFDKGDIVIFVDRLREESKSLRNILYREFFEMISKNPDGFNYQICEEIDNLIYAKTGKYIEVKNIIFKVEYDKLKVFRKREVFVKTEKFEFKNLDFSLYSTNFFDIIIELVDADEFEIYKKDRDLFFINEKYLKDIVIRNRKAGDFFEFNFGRKKLKDLFIDEKVDRTLRDILPLVEIDGKIIWAFSVRRADNFLVNKKENIVKIRVTRKGDLWKDLMK